MPDEIISIEIHLHCSMCIEEVRSGAAGGMSPADYVRLAAGLTKDGQFVLACVRHGAVICDFPAPPELQKALEGGCQDPTHEHHHEHHP